ncbi:MAG TPA: 16S rRNA (uracil(1498)-N(3))-methyltransferase [Flavobacterium sp.]|jgi:16S rRNA (uracil1498-N3)-methyltransferase
MQLFYNPTINSATETFAFDKEESRHIIKVLRKQGGDKVFVTNGLGQLFTTEIEVGSDTKCIVKIVSVQDAATPNYDLHLAVAPTKMNDRFEWFLEKATEIGISEITPIICDRSERKTIKTERFEKILQSAMKQSLQHFLPKLNQPMAYADFVKQQQKGTLLIAHCDDTQKRLLKDILQPREDLTMLIGPEGDFSQKEIKMALEYNYIPVSLGNTRLRTETAAIVACHSAAFVNE